MRSGALERFYAMASCNARLPSGRSVTPRVNPIASNVDQFQRTAAEIADNCRRVLWMPRKRRQAPIISPSRGPRTRIFDFDAADGARALGDEIGAVGGRSRAPRPVAMAVDAADLHHPAQSTKSGATTSAALATASGAKSPVV